MSAGTEKNHETPQSE